MNIQLEREVTGSNARTINPLKPILIPTFCSYFLHMLQKVEIFISHKYTDNPNVLQRLSDAFMVSLSDIKEHFMI